MTPKKLAEKKNSQSYLLKHNIQFNYFCTLSECATKTIKIAMINEKPKIPNIEMTNRLDTIWHSYNFQFTNKTVWSSISTNSISFHFNVNENFICLILRQITWHRNAMQVICKCPNTFSDWSNKNKLDGEEGINVVYEGEKNGNGDRIQSNWWFELSSRINRTHCSFTGLCMVLG